MKKGEVFALLFWLILMIEFKKLEKDVSVIKKYLPLSKNSFCDISLGIKYAWRDSFLIEYAIYNDTLIMKESGPEYKNAFYYPMGKDEQGALNQIEEYAKNSNLPLTFCYIDNVCLEQLKNRYHDVKSTYNRDWCDYIYDAEKFKTYSGKKLSGQRNHVNKFKKNYPNYSFKTIDETDFSRIKDFLSEFAQEREVVNWTERVEQESVLDLIKNASTLDQVGGLIEVDGQMVAISLGEKIGETLIVHVEKALKNYAGVYPTMAQEFARAFATEEIKFINREEDCGDLGLRTSKLQYQPIEIKAKNFVTVNTLFDKIMPPVLIETERLTVSEIIEEDAKDYARLYLDDDLNKWWGYDYREDLKGESPTPEYFFKFQNTLKEKKEEYSFAVKIDGVLVGELVLHNFDYFGGVEMGFRFFKESQGKGYATESALALKNYVKQKLGAKILKSRCFKENLPSANLIKRIGLGYKNQDKTHYYFETEL